MLEIFDFFKFFEEFVGEGRRKTSLVEILVK